MESEKRSRTNLHKRNIGEERSGADRTHRIRTPRSKVCVDAQQQSRHFLLTRYPCENSPSLNCNLSIDPTRSPD